MTTTTYLKSTHISTMCIAFLFFRMFLGFSMVLFHTCKCITIITVNSSNFFTYYIYYNIRPIATNGSTTYRVL